MTSAALGWRYLAELWLKGASKRALLRELSSCRNSPTIEGERAARIIAAELRRRGVDA